MHLVIDHGNTAIKIALFAEEKKPYRVERILRFDQEYMDNLLNTCPISNGIYSSVTGNDNDIISYLQARIPHFSVFLPDTPLPITIDYRTPQTLGGDRIAAVVGAQEEAPDKDILVIDAGTCITYDVLTADGHFRGGNISPGIKMRLKAMNRYTGKLPLVEKNGEVATLGYDTETAIRSGAVLGICYEIEGYISHLKQQYPNLFIFLTGGDAFLLAVKLKTAIFVDNTIVLKGLNRILRHNVNL
ncbi:MAG: type III pantothenate kinase [Porphyromonadaceae bacterium]|nr:type III pantothenate kinase [Porphyromonadaceae bacterium]